MTGEPIPRDVLADFDAQLADPSLASFPQVRAKGRLEVIEDLVGEGNREGGICGSRGGRGVGPG